MEAEPTPQAPAPGVEALPRRVIGVAASAGGVEALRTLVAGLSSDLDAALCVVLHIPPTGRSLLAPILDRDGPLRTVLAQHGAPLQRGTIYVAPADCHLLARAETVELSRGPKENGVRPAANPLFRSLARSWGDGAIAVVLSGALDDGAAGAVAVAEAGGEVVVQAPGDAVVPGMPSSTIAVTTPTAVVPVSEIGATLERLVAAPVPNPEREAAVRLEPDPAEMERGPNRPDGPASGFTCPEGSGASWELREGELVRYRCRVGHSYSEDVLVDSQRSAVEAALWAALEVLEERGELLRRIADRTAREGRLPRTEHRFRAGAREADERAAVIRRVLRQGIGSPGPARGDEAEQTAAG